MKIISFVKSKRHIFISLLLTYFFSCASFFGYHNYHHQNIKNQNVPEIINDPIDLSKHPNYRQNRSRKELVLHIVKNYCPEGFHIINKKRKGLNDNFMQSYFPEKTTIGLKKANIKIDPKVQMKRTILRQIGTYIHESNHGYHYNYHIKYFQQNNLYGSYSYYSYYMGNGKTYLVTKQRVFPSREINDLFPQYMKDDRSLSFRLKTYVYPSGPSQSTQLDGVFGLLDELYSYYHGCMAIYQLLPYVKKLRGNKEHNFKEYLIGVDAVRYAYHEFKLFILLYLIKAKTDYPAVYTSLMKNKGFVNAFLFVEREFKRLNRRYELSRKQLVPWLRARGYILKIEKSFTRINPIKKGRRGYSYSTSSYGHFDRVVEVYEKEMRKKKYSVILNKLREKQKIL